MQKAGADTQSALYLNSLFSGAPAEPPCGTQSIEDMDQSAVADVRLQQMKVKGRCLSHLAVALRRKVELRKDAAEGMAGNTIPAWLDG